MSELNRIAMAEAYRLGFEAGKAEKDATIAKLREAIQACVDDDFNSNALMIELTALVKPGM